MVLKQLDMSGLRWFLIRINFYDGAWKRTLSKLLYTPDCHFENVNLSITKK